MKATCRSHSRGRELPTIPPHLPLGGAHDGCCYLATWKVDHLRDGPLGFYLDGIVEGRPGHGGQQHSLGEVLDSMGGERELSPSMPPAFSAS